MMSVSCARSVVLLFVSALISTAAAATEVTPIKTPDGGIQPQVATDSAGRAHLLYYKGDPAAGDLFYTHEMTAGALDWVPSIRVNSQPGAAVAIGSIRGGQLALGRGGRVHVVWNGSGQAEPKPRQGSPVLYTRLREGGGAFEDQRNLITTAVGLDGGATIAADSEGRIFVAWHAIGTHPGEASRTVYVSASADDGRTFAPERRAITDETGACACCGMRALADAAGDLYVLYRAAHQGTNREITLLVSQDHGRSFTAAPVQPWKMDKCPLSSMSLAAAGPGIAAMAWEKEGQVYVAKTTAPAAAVTPGGSAGTRKHPVIAINGQGERLLAWTEGTGWARGGTFAWELFDAALKPHGQNGKGGPVPTWSTVAAFARPDGSFVVVY
jgi:hypothetical protein